MQAGGDVLWKEEEHTLTQFFTIIVTAISTGRTLPEYEIDARDIADLTKLVDENVRSGGGSGGGGVRQNGSVGKQYDGVRRKIQQGMATPELEPFQSDSPEYIVSEKVYNQQGPPPPWSSERPQPQMHTRHVPQPKSHTQHAPQPQSHAQHALQPQVQAIRVSSHPVKSATPTFEDPAILSVGRKPTPASRQTSSGQWSATTAMERGDSSRTAKARNDSLPHHEVNVAATMGEVLKNISLAEVAASPLNYDDLEAEVEQEEVLPEQETAKRKPRKRKAKKAADGGAHEVDVVPTKETTRSKGWRKTPLLEPNPSFQPFNSLKRNNRRGKQRIDEAGWATEDASEVQELGDFDFERSLAKFDKQSVFQKIQAEDSIAEEDRLVSHNRIPRNVKPGTNGGKNYRYDENVLGGDTSATNGAMKNVTPKGTPKVKQEVWRSEDDDEEERARGTGSGRQSRRGESKLATSRRPSERKGSAVVGGQAAVRSHSVGPFPLLSVLPANLIFLGGSTSFLATIVPPHPLRSTLRDSLNPPDAQSRKHSRQRIWIDGGYNDRERRTRYRRDSIHGPQTILFQHPVPDIGPHSCHICG